MDFTKIIELVENGHNDELKKIDFNKYLKDIIAIKNPFTYAKLIKCLEFTDDVEKYNDERKKYIKKVILNQKDENILDFFKDIKLDKYAEFPFFSKSDVEYLHRREKEYLEALTHISNRWLNDYIVYYFFGECYYDFMVNCHQMINYLMDSNKNIVTNENIDLYEKFLKLYDLPFKEKIAFFKENLQNEDLMSHFYDDIRQVRNDSYKSLVDSSLKLDHNSNIYNQELSEKYQNDVYYLDGETFYAIIRTYNISRDDLSDNSNYLYLKRDRWGFSFSYISNYNIGTIDYSNKSVAVLFDNIDPAYIAYVHHADLHSGRMNNPLTGPISNKENEISTPSSLIANTKNYNEIVIRKNDLMKPKALICYDEITNNDVLFAQKYQLAILLINTKKYRRKFEYDDDFDDYSYSM